MTFSSKLENYLSDPLIIEATELYEKAFDIFERLQVTLRLGAKGSNPMHELYELQSDEQNEVSESLAELKDPVLDRNSAIMTIMLAIATIITMVCRIESAKVLEKGWLTQEKLDDMLRPENMTDPREIPK